MVFNFASVSTTLKLVMFILLVFYIVISFYMYCTWNEELSNRYAISVIMFHYVTF